MKKVFALILIFVFILALSGCKGSKNDPTDLDSSNSISTEAPVGDQEDENTSSKDESSSQTESTESKTDSGNKNSSENKVSSGKNGKDSQNTSKDVSTSSDKTETDKNSPQGGNTGSTASGTSDTGSNTSGNSKPNSQTCVHSYTEKTVQHTCTTDGYTEFTCTKCGDTYKDEIVPAQHVFVEYICTECGVGDEEYAYDAVKFWVINNGVKKDDPSLTMYEYTFSSDEGTYSLSYSSYLTLSFDSSSLEEYIDIEIYNSENCNINYILKGQSSSATVAKSQIFSEDGAFLNNFTIPEGDSGNEFKEALKNRLNNTLLYFNDNVLNNDNIVNKDNVPIKCLKFSLTDLGFTLYSPKTTELN